MFVPFSTFFLTTATLEEVMANEGALFAADASEDRRGGAGHRSGGNRDHAAEFRSPAANDIETTSVSEFENADLPVKKPIMRRLNLNLPASLYDDLSELADSQGKTMTEIVRTGLGLAHIAYTQLGKRQKLVIADADGKPIREILIPR
jgi:hypothetical protein